MFIKHQARFRSFLRHTARYTVHLWMSLASLVLLVIFGGAVLSWIEGIKLSDGFYFACVTGLTIGYGDITPHTTPGRIVSIIIGIIGLVFTGLIVAIATQALRDSVKHDQEMS